MPTIHIHLDDSDRSLELVAELLNRHYQVSIDLDTVFNAPKRAERDPLERPFSDHRKLLPANAKRPAETAKDRIRAQRIEADAFIAERQGRDFLRQRHDDQRALRVAAKQQRYTDAFQAMSVPCPSCEVGVDEVCEDELTDDETAEDFDEIFGGRDG